MESLHVLRPGASLPSCTGAPCLCGGICVLAAQANERVAYVSAFDEKTRAPITGLGVRDFVVREDGAAREVLGVTRGHLAHGGGHPRRQHAGRDQPHRRHPPRAADVRQGARRPRPGVDHRRRRSADHPARLHHQSDSSCSTASTGCSRCPARARRCSTPCSRSAAAWRRREEDRAAMVIVTTENIEFSPRHYKEVLEALARGGAQMHAVIMNTPAGTALNDPARNRAHVLDVGPKASGGTRTDILSQPGVRRQAAGAGRHPQEPASRGLCAAADPDSTREI